MILLIFDSKEIGLWLLRSNLLPFSLYIGITFDIFSLSIYSPFAKDKLIIVDNGSARTNLHAN